MGMKLFLVLPHFEHVAQNADLAAVYGFKGIDRTHDRIGVCVIAVVNKRYIARVNDIRSAADGFIGGDTGGDLVIGKSHFNADRRTLKRSIDHVAAVGRHGDMYASFARDNVAAKLVKSVTANVLCLNIGVCARAVQDLALTAVKRREKVIIAV